MHDMNWFLERLEVAEWKDETPGSRDAMTNCPVCGSADNLHITEMNGKALVKCFSAGCNTQKFYSSLVEALDTGEVAIEAPSAVVTNRSTGALAATALSVSPLDWAASRCGMTRDQLDSLNLPLSEAEGDLFFEFEGTTTTKSRKASDAKKKEIFWQGTAHPPLWPIPVAPPEEIIITEGEFDAIALTLAHGEAYGVYSITGGAGDVPDLQAWSALYALGVRTVRVVFDADAPGRKGAEEVLLAIRAAGLEGREYQPAGMLPLRDEKDARDVATRVGAEYLELIPRDTEDDAVPLSKVPSVPPAKLLEDYIHPTEHTILYGDGGTGKGVVAAHWTANLLRAGKVILLVDYEQHAQHEWRPRVETFLDERPKSHPHGHAPDDRDLLDKAVHIVQPTRPIWDIQDWLREQVRRVGADIVMIDSVTYACVGEAAEDSRTAIKYSMAINRLGCAVLSLAHVTKTDLNPKHPFGSAYWSNGARITVAISRKEPSDGASPRILTNHKTNQRGNEPLREVDWSWLDTALPRGGLTIGDVSQNLKQTVASARADLASTIGKEPTPKEVWELVITLPDYANVTEGSVRTTLSRIVKANRDLGAKA